MSYCVNCGVKLDDTAAFCPLCHTPVQNPRQPVDTVSPTPFPTERREVPLASKWELALLLSVMLASVALCSGLLNLFLRASHIWSLYVIGAAVMLWIWLVPPLLYRKMALFLQILLDVAAVGIYVLLIAVDLGGWSWYLRLALPIVLLLGAAALFLGLLLRGGRRSILSSAALIIGSVGVFCMGVELFSDLFFHGVWSPGWSLIVLCSCVALTIPLIVVRRVPSLREEVRRRFHF